MRNTLLFALVAATAAVCHADVLESWDTGHQNWHYWASPNNEPYVTHVGSGGVGDSGYVEVDFVVGNNYHWKDLGGDLDWVYWPNYIYPEDDGLTPNVNFTGADVSVYVKGSANLNMQSGSLYFYVGKAGGPNDSLWSLFRHNTPLGIGNATWLQSTITLADTLGPGADEWVLMEGGDYTVAETLAHPLEFGFTITGVQENEDNPTGILGFDEFFTTGDIVPEPVSLTVIGLGGLMLLRRRRG